MTGEQIILSTVLDKEERKIRKILDSFTFEDKAPCPTKLIAKTFKTFEDKYEKYKESNNIADLYDGYEYEDELDDLILAPKKPAIELLRDALVCLDGILNIIKMYYWCLLIPKNRKKPASIPIEVTEEEWRCLLEVWELGQAIFNHIQSAFNADCLPIIIDTEERDVKLRMFVIPKIRGKYQTISTSLAYMPIWLDLIRSNTCKNVSYVGKYIDLLGEIIDQDEEKPEEKENGKEE